MLNFHLACLTFSCLVGHERTLALAWAEGNHQKTEKHPTLVGCVCFVLANTFGMDLEKKSAANQPKIRRPHLLTCWSFLLTVAWYRQMYWTICCRRRDSNRCGERRCTCGWRCRTADADQAERRTGRFAALHWNPFGAKFTAVVPIPVSSGSGVVFFRPNLFGLSAYCNHCAVFVCVNAVRLRSGGYEMAHLGRIPFH